jgi:hypothetical protein
MSIDIGVYFGMCGYETFSMGNNQVLIRKGNINMSVEIMVDNNWFGTQYPLRELIIYKNRLQTRNDWLCVTNRDKTEFYIIPMCVVLSALQVSRESKKTTKEIMYIVDTSLAQYSYKEGSLYF